MGWAHAVAVMVKKSTAQNRGRASQLAAPRHRLGPELGLPRLEQRGIDNGLGLTAVTLAWVAHLANIEAVLEQISERPSPDPPSADATAVRQPPWLAANSLPTESLS